MAAEYFAQVDEVPIAAHAQTIVAIAFGPEVPAATKTKLRTVHQEEMAQLRATYQISVSAASDPCKATLLLLVGEVAPADACFKRLDLSDRRADAVLPPVDSRSTLFAGHIVDWARRHVTRTIVVISSGEAIDDCAARLCSKLSLTQWIGFAMFSGSNGVWFALRQEFPDEPSELLNGEIIRIGREIKRTEPQHHANGVLLCRALSTTAKCGTP